jgi:hypothetical protein
MFGLGTTGVGVLQNGVGTRVALSAEYMTSTLHDLSPSRSSTGEDTF